MGAPHQAWRRPPDQIGGGPQTAPRGPYGAGGAPAAALAAAQAAELAGSLRPSSAETSSLLLNGTPIHRTSGRVRPEAAFATTDQPQLVQEFDNRRRPRVLPAAPAADPTAQLSISGTGSRISEADASFPAFEDPGTSPAPLPRLANLGGPGGGSCGSQARLRTPASRIPATLGFAHHGSPQPAVPLIDHAVPGFGDIPDGHLGSALAHSPRPSAGAANSVDSSWVPLTKPVSERPPSVPPVNLEALVADPCTQPVLTMPAPPFTMNGDGAHRIAEPVAMGSMMSSASRPGTIGQQLPPPPSAFGSSAQIKTSAPGNRSDVLTLPNGDVRRGRSRPESPASDRRSWEALPPAPPAACWFAEKAEELQRRRGSSLPPAPRGGATSSWAQLPQVTGHQNSFPWLPSTSSGSAGVWPPPPLPPLSEELRHRLETLELQRLAQLKAESGMSREIEELRTELSTWKACCERLKADAASAEAAAMASAKSEAEARRALRELEAEYDRLRILRETSERQCFDQTSENTTLREELRVHQKSRQLDGHLREEHEQLKADIERQRSMRMETDRLRQEAVAECDQLREELARAKEDINSTRQKSAHVELLQSQSHDHAQKLREERDRLEAALRQKEASLRQREERHSTELHERETRMRLELQKLAGLERDYKQKTLDLEDKASQLNELRLQNDQLIIDNKHLQKVSDERLAAEGFLREGMQSEAQHLRATQAELRQSQESERRLREAIALLESEKNELVARNKLAEESAALRRRSTTPLSSTIGAVVQAPTSTAPALRAEAVSTAPSLFPRGRDRMFGESESRRRSTTHLVVDLREDDNPLVDEMEVHDTSGVDRE